MTLPARLETGVVVEMSKEGCDDALTHAAVASVLDSGVVLAPKNGYGAFGPGQRVRLVAHLDDQVAEVAGTVAGSSEAGIAVHVEGHLKPFERATYPRVSACIPMRYARLDEGAAERARAAIRSKIPASRTVRPSEIPGDRTDIGAVLTRLQRMETAITLLTDLVLHSGAAGPTLTERELVISAESISFAPDPPGDLAPGDTVELDLILPLGEPTRVRCAGTVMRLSATTSRVLVHYDAIDEDDRDQVGRYVFQLQRRRQLRR